MQSDVNIYAYSVFFLHVLTLKASHQHVAFFKNAFMAVLFHRFLPMGTYVLVSNFADRVGAGKNH